MLVSTHARVRGRQDAQRHDGGDEQFQLTPAYAGDRLRVALRLGDLVSTHARVRGRRPGSGARDPAKSVSTHARVRGRPNARQQQIGLGCFNSRPRTRATSVRRRLACRRRVSTHARVRGRRYVKEEGILLSMFQLTPAYAGDARRSRRRRTSSRFNSRPRTRATEYRSPSTRCARFQLTPAYAGDTKNNKRREQQNVSTHARVRGRLADVIVTSHP